MDAITRVESRIFDVQSRFARMTGRSSFAPTNTVSVDTTSAESQADASGRAASSSFRDVAQAALRSAQNDGPSSLVASAATKTPGMYGSITLPSELAGTENGRLPDTLLDSIGQGSHRLERTAATAFRRMAAAAAQDGVDLAVSDSYRSYADQQRVAGSVGLYREGGLAAVPGTSTHGWGLSVDVVQTTRTQTWLRANANRFGFAQDVAREPWHYTYRPANT